MDTGGVSGMDELLASLNWRSAKTDTKVVTNEGKVIERSVEAQVALALEDADLVVMMCDSSAGVSFADEAISGVIRRLQKYLPGRQESVLLAVNKVDNPQRLYDLPDFYKLGLGEPIPISALHGTGVPDLLTKIVEALPEHHVEEEEERAAAAAKLEVGFENFAELISEAEIADQKEAGAAREPTGAFGREDGEDGPSELQTAASGAKAGVQLKEQFLKLAVVGRPNVGKSSFINRLLGEERHVVHETAGTTRDAVSSDFSWADHQMRIADTAGIRRRGDGGVNREELDRMAVVRAQQMLKNSHVALVLYDAQEGLVRQDLRIASEAASHYKSCVLVANKTDLLNTKQREKLEEDLRMRLPQLKYAPLVLASVKTGHGIDAAMELVVEAARWRKHKVSRRRLTELFERAQLLRPLSNRVRIRHITQSETETPTFAVHLNKETDMHPSEVQWIENTLRSQWPYTATPIRFVIKMPPPRKRKSHNLRGAAPAKGSSRLRLTTAGTSRVRSAR